jgi:hypothetical protein
MNLICRGKLRIKFSLLLVKSYSSTRLSGQYRIHEGSSKVSTTDVANYVIVQQVQKENNILNDVRQGCMEQYHTQLNGWIDTYSCTWAYGR